MADLDTEISQAAALLQELRHEKDLEAHAPTGPTGATLKVVTGPTGGTLAAPAVAAAVATPAVSAALAPVPAPDVWPWGHNAAGERNTPPADVPSSGGTGAQDGNATMHQILHR